MNNKPLITVSVALATVLIVGCAQQSEPSGQSRLESKQPVPVEEYAAIDEDAGLPGRSNRIGALKVEQERAPASRVYAREVLKVKAAGALLAADLSAIRMPNEPVNRENYAHFDDNPVKLVAEAPVSTFSIDVDTGAYSNVRRMLNAGQVPVRDAVRVEEMINYFAYDYPTPAAHETPFKVTTEIGPNPWNSETRLLHIGIKGYDVDRQNLPPANLVFLVDVSGSMQSANKLGLLKSALKLLTRQLREQDRISLVVYAGASGVVLEPVKGNERAKIQHALEGLTAGGRTNGAAGIRLAYQLAEDSFIEKGINRVIIATDGDFNVGTVNFEALIDLIEEKRKSSISLTTLGFGNGNYNDRLMEQLADAGNGNYAYIDSLNEAQKVLVDEMEATLQTIAKDVKIQIEFNPALVAEYRLIGYENRSLQREDFNNDKVDAGDIGAGHTVTALYEIVLTDGKGQRVDPLRYGGGEKTTSQFGEELAMLRLRYKQPDEGHSRLIKNPLYITDIETSLQKTSDRFRFSAAVAGFGQLLRGGKYVDDFDYQAVLELARNARGADRFGYRGEFIQMVSLADSLHGNAVRASR
ncbi:MAG: VWA domain-containing protein [Gammaproteobacteria bacterium]|nr:MAG: VWA domain-containing protein [Gammaproteobacteria bacterium]